MDSYQRVLMGEVKRAYGPGEGRHWFDADTLRYFRTKLPGRAIKVESGTYFVTQETSPSGKTAYTIRRQDPDNGSIGTLGLFHSYETYAEAKSALHSHLEAEVEHV